jgi:sortase B
MKKFLRKYWFQLAAIVFIAAIVMPQMVFMLTPKIIETGSMQPTLPVYSLVIIQPTDTLKPNDVITFKQDSDAHPITHRFIGYAEDGSLITKGDANSALDVRSVPLQMSDVEGKVVYVVPFLVPFLSLAFWSSLQGLISLGIIVLALAVIAGVYFKDKRKSLKDAQIQQAKTLASHPA